MRSTNGRLAGPTMADFTRQENCRPILSQQDRRANVQDRILFCQGLASGTVCAAEDIEAGAEASNMVKAGRMNAPQNGPGIITPIGQSGMPLETGLKAFVSWYKTYVGF